jgi:hypothetical protein
MRVCAERDLFDPRKQRQKTGFAGNLGSERQRIDEEPDQRRSLGSIASRHRRPDDEVLLAGKAMKEDVEGGEQAHEEGQAFAVVQ